MNAIIAKACVKMLPGKVVYDMNRYDLGGRYHVLATSASFARSALSKAVERTSSALEIFGVEYGVARIEGNRLRMRTGKTYDLPFTFEHGIVERCALYTYVPMTDTFCTATSARIARQIMRCGVEPVIRVESAGFYYPLRRIVVTESNEEILVDKLGIKNKAEAAFSVTDLI